jgi:hypothetical protein
VVEGQEGEWCGVRRRRVRRSEEEIIIRNG